MAEKLEFSQMAYYLVEEGGALADKCAAHFAMLEGIRTRAEELVERYGADSARFGRHDTWPWRYLVHGLVFHKDNIPYRWEFNEAVKSFHPDTHSAGWKPYQDFYGSYKGGAFIRYFGWDGSFVPQLDVDEFLPEAEQAGQTYVRMDKVGERFVLGLFVPQDEEQLELKNLVHPLVSGACVLTDDEMAAMCAAARTEPDMDSKPWLPSPLRADVFQSSDEVMESLEGNPMKQFRLGFWGHTFTSVGEGMSGLYKKASAGLHYLHDSEDLYRRSLQRQSRTGGMGRRP